MLACAVAARLAAGGLAAEDDPFGREATWAAPSYSAARQAVTDWLRARPADPQVSAQIAALWPAEPADQDRVDLLDRLAATFAAVDPRARALLGAENQGPHGPRSPADPRARALLADADQGPYGPRSPAGASAADGDEPFAWLLEPGETTLMKANLRLYCGRSLARQNRFDAALRLFGDLAPGDVLDPAALLFYRAVARHRLVDVETALQDLDQLLERPDDLPRRFRRLARLMRDDLSSVKVDSLDHIARRMDDVRRRLSLGETDQKIRTVEDGVIESLDKIIRQVEEAEKAAQAQSQASAGQLQSSAPAQDSLPMGGKGPGKVQPKDIGDTSDWGNLPPKQREEAMQQIARDFPAHYRDVIQQYFKKLATENNQ